MGRKAKHILDDLVRGVEQIAKDTGKCEINISV